MTSHPAGTWGSRQGGQDQTQKRTLRVGDRVQDLAQQPRADPLGKVLSRSPQHCALLPRILAALARPRRPVVRVQALRSSSSRRQRATKHRRSGGGEQTARRIPCQTKAARGASRSPRSRSGRGAASISPSCRSHRESAPCGAPAAGSSRRPRSSSKGLPGQREDLAPVAGTPEVAAGGHEQRGE